MNTLTVLLVEDSPDDAFFFKRALTKSQVSVELRLAHDGVEAMKYLSQPARFANAAAPRRPDVVFLDLKMPNANGFDVLHWLQTQKFDPPLFIVVLTSSEEPSDIELARRLGAKAYLPKPITPEQVKQMLQQISVAPQATA